MKMQKLLVASGLLLCVAYEALGDDTYILATGRRDPRMYAIDLKKALRPENNNTPNAIVSRSKVSLDRLDGRPLGDPANIVISEDGKTAYIVNHHGAVDNAEFNQHGGRGNIAVMDVKKMIKRKHDNTADALVSTSTAVTSARSAWCCSRTRSSSATPKAISPRMTATASASSIARPAACAAWWNWRSAALVFPARLSRCLSSLPTGLRVP